MNRLYEGMFLLDNQVVRADWKRAKSGVTDTLTKHGAQVKSARRWDERKLAYPIRGKTRATYLLTYFEIGPQGVNAMRRDLELDERLLRYLILNAPVLPEGELEQSQAELGADFSVPPPPEEEVSSREQTEFGHLRDEPEVVEVVEDVTEAITAAEEAANSGALDGAAPKTEERS